MKVCLRMLVLLVCVLLLHSVELWGNQGTQPEASKELRTVENSSRELSEVDSNVLSKHFSSKIVTRIADDVISGLLDIFSSICGFSVSEDVPSNDGLSLSSTSHNCILIPTNTDDDGLIDELL